MNSEQLINEAGKAIDNWRKQHNTSCRLCIVKGHVVCVKWDYSYQIRVKPLQITPWEQEHGLTSNTWKMIGNALFNLYIKELACQDHQKP